MDRESDGSSPAPLPVVAVGALFLVSGAAGLVYEVLWSRQLARVLGGSYPAVVAVVAAFLGGLALGAGLGGRLAARTRRPLRAYALLEAGIAVYCALFPLLLSLLHPVFGAAYRGLADSPALHAAVRFALAGLLLLPPTIAMGATLPVLVRGVVRTSAGVLGGTGLLYGLNTVGAAGGALAAGLLLLPALGYPGTLAVAVGANLLVAAVALVLDARFAAAAAAPAEAPPVAETAPPAPPLAPRVRRAVLVGAGAAGFAAMLCQMAWTRMLILSFGSSVHAFTLVVAVFILGLGLGGLATPLLRVRPGAMVPALAALQAAVGLAAWASVAFLADLPLRVIERLGAGGVRYGDLLTWQFGQALSAALLPTLAMGAAFPVFVAAVAGDAGGAPRAVGRVYGWNTAGTIAGSLCGGLLLVPGIGTRDTLVLACGINLALAGVLLAVSLPPRRGLPAALAAAGAVVLVATGSAPWRPELLHSGAAVYASTYAARAAASGRSVDRLLRDRAWDRLLDVEGRSVTVAVTREPGGDIALLINGKADASTGQDMTTQQLLGHLPALLHGSPSRAMVVGLASGVSAAAVESHGVTVLDVAEIAPEVALAEPFFRHVNGDVTRRAGVQVLLEDGRTHIEHAERTYDVLVSEPTNPWIAGVSDLFTVEYFRACRERLAPGGTVCIWLQSYGLALDDLRLVLRTVREVFPDAVVFDLVPWSDYGIVATREGDRDIVAELASRPWPAGRAAEGLAAAGLTGPADVLATLHLGREAAAAFAGPSGAGLHTDAHLSLEFRAPRGAMGDPDYPRCTWMDLEALRDPGPLPAVPGLAERAEACATARAGYLAFMALRDAALARVVTGNLLANPDAFAACRPHLPADLLRRTGPDPRTFPPGESEALVRAEAIRALDVGVRAGVTFRWAKDALAEALLVRGERAIAAGLPEAALEDMERAAALRPGEALAPLALAHRARAAAGDDPRSPLLDEALARVEDALRANPRCEAAFVERALVHIQRRDHGAAEATLRDVLALRPDSVRALGVFGELRRLQGATADALLLVDAGLALEPGHRELRALREALAPGR